METKENLWAARIDEWKRSGLTQRQYCEDNRLPHGTFAWWRKRLKDQEAARRSAPFVEIPPERALRTATPDESQLKIGIGRYSVIITGTVDFQQLEEVLNVLERR